MTALMSSAFVDNAGAQAHTPSSPTVTTYTPTHMYPPRTSSVRNHLASGYEAAPTGPSLEPPPGMTYAQFVNSWMDAHIARWLADAKCAHLASAFQTNDIRGDVLLELDQPTLKEMGITSIGDRVRIINAVKILRQKCSSSRTSLGSTPAPDSNRAGSHSRTGSSGNKLDASAGRTRRPAPLNISQTIGQQDLPRIVHNDGQDSARPRLLQQPTPNTAGPSSAQLSAVPTPGSTTPYAANADRNKPQLSRIAPLMTPGSRTPASARKYQIPAAADMYANAPLPMPPAGASYGLPSDPRPSNVGGARPPPARAPSPHSSNQSRDRRSPEPGHSRNPSLGNPAPSQSTKLPPRPSTGPSAHPYAAAGSSGGGSGGGGGLRVPQTTNLVTDLSPIAESFGGVSPVTPAPPSSIPGAAGGGAYSVGRGPFTRPTTPGQAGHSLIDLRRKLVKFLLPDEGRSITVDVADCTGGIEVLEKALKKFNKVHGRTVEHVVQTADGGLVLDGWGVFVDWAAPDSPPLSEADLLAVCHARPDDPVRGHGLTLRKAGKGARPRPLHGAFGEAPQIQYSSPTSPGFQEESPASSSGLSAAGPSPMSMRRASSISILSGLGVPNPETLLEPPTSPTLPAPAPAAPSVPQAPPPPYTRAPDSAQGKSKLRNFFGQRPPSELITTHLPDYFPGAERKILARTQRHSMLRAGRRDSAASWATAAGGPRYSRFSVSTQASGASSFAEPRPSPLSGQPLSAADAEPPRLSLSTEDGRSFDLQSERAPGTISNESLARSMANLTRNESSDRVPPRPSSAMSQTSRMSRSSRMSYLTELRGKRDMSDAASILTVDQITEKVENRRSSRLLVADEVNQDGWTEVGEEESDEDSGSATVAAEEDDEESVTSTEEDDVPDRTANKWIKGALIGAGSFGQVYLGMDASSGLLMAVKQVEQPKGNTPNDERKKSMLTALEREIELLQDLQHQNIVQYLYSSTDDDYLNIFLEYVPGGSITALLRNYGAFEEPLVRNFLRQTLQGLEYLHAKDIIHRDIKGANILVDNKGSIKISDFGISKKATGTLTGNKAHRPSLQGSVFWMAPEVVKQTAHNNKADIWSVGCLVVEMFTGEHPWSQLSQMQAIFKIGMSAKPEIPSDISSEAHNFLELAFDLDYEKRPSATESLQHPWLIVKPVKSRTKASQADA